MISIKRISRILAGMAGRLVSGVSAYVSFVLLSIILFAWMRSYSASDQAQLFWPAKSATGGTICLMTVGYESGRLIVDRELADGPSTRHFYQLVKIWEEMGIPPLKIELGRPKVSWCFLGGRVRPAWTFSRLGIEVKSYNSWSEDFNYPKPAVHAAIPFWTTLLLLLPMPIWQFFSFRKRKLERYRAQHLQCTVCGYDLRASPQRCPECGTQVTKPAKFLGDRIAPLRRVIAGVAPFAVAAWVVHFAVYAVEHQRTFTAELKASEILAEPLGNAVGKGDLSMVRLLLDHGADITDRGLLHSAAAMGNLGMINLLLDRGAPVNQVLGDRGPTMGARTALTDAMLNGRSDAARLLVRRGADPYYMRLR